MRDQPGNFDGKPKVLWRRCCPLGISRRRVRSVERRVDFCAAEDSSVALEVRAFGRTTVRRRSWHRPARRSNVDSTRHDCSHAAADSVGRSARELVWPRGVGDESHAARCAAASARIAVPLQLSQVPHLSKPGSPRPSSSMAVRHIAVCAQITICSNLAWSRCRRSSYAVANASLHSTRSRGDACWAVHQC